MQSVQPEHSTRRSPRMAVGMAVLLVTLTAACVLQWREARAACTAPVSDDPLFQPF
jgi:hypothetical protein